MQGCAKDFTEDKKKCTLMGKYTVSLSKVLNVICVKSIHLDTSVKEKIIHES